MQSTSRTSNREVFLDLQKEIANLGLSPLESAKEFDRQIALRGLNPDIFLEEYTTLGDEADSNGSESGVISSDSDDESTIEIALTKRESILLREKQAKTDFAKRIYSRESLLSMIPSSKEFDGLRERLRIQKTVYRFDPKKSNRKYSFEYLKRNGVPVPKDHPKVAVVLTGDDLQSFYGKDRPFVKRNPPFGGKDILHRIVYRDSEVIGIAKYHRQGWIPRGRRPPKTTCAPTRPFRGVRRARRLNVVKDEWFETHLGGQTRPIKTPPVSLHKKYWYFLRKRGFWVPSEHHPYGDENEAYGLNV